MLQSYPTTSGANVLRLSDSSKLSDNFRSGRTLIVGFFGVIRQLPERTYSDCRMLQSYPTTSGANVLRLSDSSKLSDNFRGERTLIVGCFRVIRQFPERTYSDCRMLQSYPTTSGMFVASARKKTVFKETALLLTIFFECCFRG